ncbi:MAG: DUF5050 domain-containing protein [Anaerolineae bacterium]
MKRRNWIFIIVSLLLVLALSGCQLLNAFGLLPDSHDSKDEKPLSYTELDTATPSGKVVATKPAGKATAAATAKPGTATGRIAFISNRDGNYEIYTMNTDGSDQQRLTTIGEHTVNPAWSPDGSKLAFVSDKFGQDYGTAELYTCNADGSDIRRLTTNKYNEFQPAWSPDGKQIAFASDRDDNYDIYVMNADGSGETRLTTEPKVDWQPDWSRDGKQITFSSTSGGKNLNIYIMNSDGSEVRRLTDVSDNHTEPTFSPDGQLIAFIATYADGGSALCVMKIDGSGLKELVISTGTDLTNPDWSPDGTMLAYTDRPGGGVRSEIYIVRADGSNPTRITENAFTDFSPVWMPE